MRPNLVAVPNSDLHDLPPRWDGRAVVWTGWRPTSGFVCGPHGRILDCCESCGSVEFPTINKGLVADDADMTHDDLMADDQASRTAMALRSRRARERRSWFRLSAFRCVECGHDSVLDDKGVMWELDVTDYGDEGSIAPRPDRGTA